MIDVEKLKLGDIVESDGTICNFPKGTKHKVVPATELGSCWISGDSVAIDGFSYVEENFTLVATNTKYSDIGEGDVVEVALVDEDKLRVWTEIGELIGKQGRVVYKGRMIDVDFDGVVWRFDAHELRVVFSVTGNLVGDLMGMSKGIDFDKFFPPVTPSSGLKKAFKEGPPAPPKKATDFLSKALSLLEERGKDYDQPEGERSMGKTVTAFNAVTGHNLKESDGWLLLQLLKDVRQNQNRDSYHADSAEDCISYAALKAEALAEGK